jgi:predicted patatin/cPLA2 family phospholipase
LVIEGGAMRGVVSAGMVAALEQLEMRDCFDVVYGSSAGAISGAYFIADQARYGTTIFYENINNKQFIELRRLLWGRPAVSLEFLLDTVCRHQKPLAFDRVLNSDIPLNVVAASLSLKKAVALSGFQDSAELIEALRASSRIPLLAGPPVELRGDRFLDASFYESIPFRAAIADGATDLLLLMTRPSGDLRSESKWYDKYIIAPYLARLDPDLANHYLARANEYRIEIGQITQRHCGSAAPRILSVQIPSDADKVASLETSRSRLVAGAMSGFAAVYRSLGFAVPELVEIITPFAAP